MALFWHGLRWDVMETNTSQSPPTPPLFPLLFLKRGRWWHPRSSLFHSLMSAPLPPPEHARQGTLTHPRCHRCTLCFHAHLKSELFYLFRNEKGNSPGSIYNSYARKHRSSAQQSEDITVTRGHDPQWILKCFKATAARPVRNTRDLLNCVHYKWQVVNGDSQLRVLLPQVVHLQASTNLKKCKIIISLKKTSFKISYKLV